MPRYRFHPYEALELPPQTHSDTVRERWTLGERGELTLARAIAVELALRRVSPTYVGCDLAELVSLPRSVIALACASTPRTAAAMATIAVPRGARPFDGGQDCLLEIGEKPVAFTPPGAGLDLA
jgi:hypothetical protein